MTARNASVVMAAVFTPSTVYQVIGCSWDTAQRKRVAAGLPLLRLGPQTPAIELAPFLEALRAEAALRPEAKPAREPVALENGQEGAETEPTDAQLRAEPVEKEKAQERNAIGAEQPTLAEITARAREHLRGRLG